MSLSFLDVKIYGIAHMGNAFLSCQDYTTMSTSKIILTHWGQATPICVGKQNIMFLPDRRQVIIWTNAGVLLMRTLEKI